MATKSAGLSWTHDLSSVLERARSENRHVLLDFTAAPM
jgi:hypothetical protein